MNYGICWGVVLSRSSVQGAVHQDTGNITGNNYSAGCLKPTISQKLFL